MEKHYFTFGFASNYRNGYVCITAKDYGEARHVMVEHFGLSWAFQYSEKEFAGQIEKYHLHEVPLNANEGLGDERMNP